MTLKLIKSIRDFLNDPDSHRWKDTAIRQYINEAITDLASETKVFKKHGEIPLVAGQALYSCPDDFLTLDQAYINNKELELCSYNSLDTRNTLGVPEAIIVDQNDADNLTLHPTPAVVGADGIAIAGQGFGTFDPNSGEVYRGLYFGSSVTIASGQTIDPSKLVIYYSYIPKLIPEGGTQDNAINVPPRYIKYLRHYVCGMLLRADKDTNSRALAMEELKFYAIGIAKIKKEVTVSFTTNHDRHTVNYRRI